MGARNKDRFPLHAWADRVRTVEHMIAAGWLVISRCPVCQLDIAADLPRIAREKPGTVLWNARAPCRRLGCQGKVVFMAPHPGRPNSWEPLTAPDVKEPELGWARQRLKDIADGKVPKR